MSSWVKVSKTTAQELYLPTEIRGLYMSPTISALPDRIRFGIRHPGATNHSLEWSSSWDETRKARDDKVTIPTLKASADTSVDKHGRTGVRVPGIFVASEEVEKPLLVVWTLDGGTRSIIQIEPVGKEGQQERDEAEQDEYVMVPMC